MREMSLQDSSTGFPDYPSMPPQQQQKHHVRQATVSNKSIIQSSLRHESSIQILKFSPPASPTRLYGLPHPPKLGQHHRRESSFVSPITRPVNSLQRNELPRVGMKQMANYQRFTSEAQHTLAHDKFSDYSQSPMHIVDGVLDDSLYDYINPAMVGELPILWLPGKSTTTTNTTTQ